MSSPVSGQRVSAEIVKVSPLRESAPAEWLLRRRSYPWWVVGTVCVGALMGQLDASIAQIILPALEVQFRASVGAVAWVSVAYLLVMAAMLPVAGWLADQQGRKRLYAFGLGLFGAGSAVCGFAPSLPILIVARMIQALGGTLLSANSVALIVSAVGPERRGRALGIQSAAQSIGLCLGPALGGLLLDSLGWRWVFWVNVPISVVGWCAARWILPQTIHHPAPKPLDVPGVVCLVPGLALLFLALHEAGHFGVGSGRVVGYSLGAVVCLIGLVRRELRASSPLLDLTLIRDRSFAAGSIAGLLSYVILFATFLVLPFVLVRAYGDTAFSTGLQLAIIPTALALMAPVGGVLNDRLGARMPTVVGMLLIAAGLVMLAVALDGETGGRGIAMVGLGFIGAGQGLFIAPNNSSVMAVASPEEKGQAGGLINLMRSLGMSLGITLGSILLTGGSRHATVVELLRGSRWTWIVLAGIALAAAVLSGLRASPRAGELSPLGRGFKCGE
ncbi:MAG: DHA2 family efflux MFS transporter permease subunit [Verrucomicrobiota bacterium]